MLPKNKWIQRKEDLKSVLETELSGYGIKKRKIFFPFKEVDILAKHTIFLRKAEYHCNTKHKLRGIYYKFRLRLMQQKYALHIPMNCCDKGLKIMHLGPVLMNEDVVVGKNCSIHMNTGLVAGGVTSKAPILGDGVVVGFGAVILGGIYIADNVAIGANAVVNKDVTEENVAVAGVPAKIISHNGRLSWNRSIYNEAE